MAASLLGLGLVLGGLTHRLGLRLLGRWGDDGGAAAGFEVPDLVGLTVNMAKNKLASMGLMIGIISSTSAITDTANAFIIQQSPSPFTGQLDSLGMPMKNLTMQGGSIDIVVDKVAPVISKDSIK